MRCPSPTAGSPPSPGASISACASPAPGAGAALLVLEPTASLDLRHEMELFERARLLAAPAGLAVLVITHHVNLATRFADRVLLLHEGRAAAQGRPGDVLTRDTVERVFDWPVTIERFDGAPQIVPLRRPQEAR
jgi:iron complex transport system ATP-binding protein